MRGGRIFEVFSRCRAWPGRCFIHDPHAAHLLGIRRRHRALRGRLRFHDERAHQERRRLAAQESFRARRAGRELRGQRRLHARASSTTPRPSRRAASRARSSRSSSRRASRRAISASPSEYAEAELSREPRRLAPALPRRRARRRARQPAPPRASISCRPPSELAEGRRTSSSRSRVLPRRHAATASSADPYFRDYLKLAPEGRARRRGAWLADGARPVIPETVFNVDAARRSSTRSAATSTTRRSPRS